MQAIADADEHACGTFSNMSVNSSYFKNYGRLLWYSVKNNATH